MHWMRRRITMNNGDDAAKMLRKAAVC